MDIQNLKNGSTSLDHCKEILVYFEGKMLEFRVTEQRVSRIAIFKYVSIFYIDAHLNFSTSQLC